MKSPKNYPKFTAYLTPFCRKTMDHLPLPQLSHRPTTLMFRSMHMPLHCKKPPMILKSWKCPKTKQTLAMLGKRFISRSASRLTIVALSFELTLILAAAAIATHQTLSPLSAALQHCLQQFLRYFTMRLHCFEKQRVWFNW